MRLPEKEEIRLQKEEEVIACTFPKPKPDIDEKKAISLLRTLINSEGLDEYGIPKGSLGHISGNPTLPNGKLIAKSFEDIQDAVLEHIFDNKVKIKQLCLEAGVDESVLEEVEDDLDNHKYKIIDIMGEHMGKVFQEAIKKYRDDIIGLFDAHIVKSHFDTLEEMSVNCIMKCKAGKYKYFRDAWKDAVKIGYTYMSKNKKTKVENWKQLERALERIRDKNLEERHSLPEPSIK